MLGIFIMEFESQATGRPQTKKKKVTSGRHIVAIASFAAIANFFDGELLLRLKECRVVFSELQCKRRGLRSQVCVSFN
jgi:hypothetical protein